MANGGALPAYGYSDPFLDIVPRATRIKYLVTPGVDLSVFQALAA
jgi:hypothetical protein